MYPLQLYYIPAFLVKQTPVPSLTVLPRPHQLSGRDMFMYNPNMGDGDLEEGDEGMDLTGLKDEELEEAEKDIVVRTFSGAAGGR